MPKRSNEFQQVIYLIQRSLAASATVTQSKMLTNKATGGNAEVDIVIQSNVGGHDLTISVECTAKGRVATVEWIREMLGKHIDLPTDKLVLVSKSGFTEEAAKSAKSNGISLLSVEQASEFDWKAKSGSGLAMWHCYIARPDPDLPSFQSGHGAFNCPSQSLGNNKGAYEL